ncbi:MAG: transaldolase family protein [Christensenellales bacterium]
MNEYLAWLDRETQGVWWHDSAIPEEIDEALASGAKGVTLNPVLVYKALTDRRDYWRPILVDIPAGLEKKDKVNAIISRVTMHTAARFERIFEESQGKWGYVCAQVDPRRSSDRTYMLEMAKMFSGWAKNVAVKLPITAAGLDVLEECVALGIPVVGTVSFTLSQIIQIEKRYQAGLIRGEKEGVKAAPCIAVVMVGRIDDYMRDVITDAGRYDVHESDIIQIGSAIMKRALSIWKQNEYKSILMPAGMRGGYHAQALSGAPMAFSIHPKIQKQLKTIPKPYTTEIDIHIDQDTLARLCKVDEFMRAYEPDGMIPEEFIRFGVVQKTLAQFTESWNGIENYIIKEAAHESVDSRILWKNNYS